MAEINNIPVPLDELNWIVDALGGVSLQIADDVEIFDHEKFKSLEDWQQWRTARQIQKDLEHCIYILELRRSEELNGERHSEIQLRVGKSNSDAPRMDR